MWSGPAVQKPIITHASLWWWRAWITTSDDRRHMSGGLRRRQMFSTCVWEVENTKRRRRPWTPPRCSQSFPASSSPSSITAIADGGVCSRMQLQSLFSRFWAPGGPWEPVSPDGGWVLKGRSCSPTQAAFMWKVTPAGAAEENRSK